jgi:hypothetical protein
MAIAVAIAVAQAPAEAHALQPLRTLVISAHSSQGSPDAAVEREVRAELARIDQVHLLAPPPLDLEAVQLAIDCTDESAGCLREVAERMEARVLIVPSVERADGNVVMRVLYFDSEADEAPRALEREGGGSAVDGELLAKLPEMLRELLGVKDEPVESSAADEAPEVQPAPEEVVAPSEPETGGPSLLAPALIGAGGLGAVAAGLVVGAMMKETEDDYAAHAIDTQMQARLAEEDRKRGQDQALVATILLGAGAAAIVTSGIWFALVSTSEDRPAQASLVPVISPHSAGVALLGTLEATR